MHPWALYALHKTYSALSTLALVPAWLFSYFRAMNFYCLILILCVNVPSLVQQGSQGVGTHQFSYILLHVRNAGWIHYDTSMVKLHAFLPFTSRSSESKTWLTSTVVERFHDRDRFLMFRLWIKWVNTKLLSQSPWRKAEMWDLRWSLCKFKKTTLDL